MQFIGMELKRPSFKELTVAVAIGVALWAVFVSIGFTADSTPVSVGATLAAVLWGCVSSAFGIKAHKGGRHLLFNIGGCVLILVLYDLVATLF